MWNQYGVLVVGYGLLILASFSECGYLLIGEYLLYPR